MGGKETKQNERNLQSIQPVPHLERERHVLIHQRQGFLKDTVGKPGSRGMMRCRGYHVFENTITLADAGRNGADREADLGRA